MSKNIIKQYPNIASWIQDGTIEIGNEYGRKIVARAIDEGGVIWEKGNFSNFNQAVNGLEQGIKKWIDKNY